MTFDIGITLDKLLATKFETETIEFNEANLHNGTWLVFGVEDKKNIIVGTNYRNDAKSLNSLKEEIGKQTSDNLTFIEIYECLKDYNTTEGEYEAIAEVRKDCSAVGGERPIY